MIRTAQFRILFLDIGFRFYRGFYWLLFHLLLSFRKERVRGSGVIQVKTDHPIAYESPDHLVPWGTMNDNSSNKKFVLHMQTLIQQQQPPGPRAFMDLGCSGGQVVKDFKDLGWQAVGIEGSDYSLRHKRANWKELANKNLFTADITKPFEVTEDVKPLRFDLITAWEVLEHISEAEMTNVFNNIIKHLKPGGLFVASTSSVPDIHDGVDLHQCKRTVPQWREWIEKDFPELRSAEVGLNYYDYVRFSIDERASLAYRQV
jgi:SAM-dependent methyltransferase